MRCTRMERAAGADLRPVGRVAVAVLLVAILVLVVLVAVAALDHKAVAALAAAV